MKKRIFTEGLEWNLPDGTTERFWRSIKKTESCWLCDLKSRSKWGHAQFQFKVNGRRAGTFASRFSWFIHRGAIPGKLMVLHKCKNPNCVNPGHLYLGDERQNGKDMEDFGRPNHPIGAKAVRSILTEEDVRFIRSSYRPWVKSGEGTLSYFSQKLGVSKACISRVLSGRAWKHVPFDLGFKAASKHVRIHPKRLPA